MSRRLQRGEGKDMGGTQIRSRFEELERASLEAKQAAAGRPRGSAPSPDPGARGSKIANVMHASDAGFEVYTEAPGGRAGTRGKRKS